MKRFSICFFLFLFVQTKIFGQEINCGSKNKNIDFLSQIKCKKDFDNLQSQPLKKNYSNVQSIKIVYELATDKIYYTQSNKYPFHFSFCNEYLHSYENVYDFNKIEYSISEHRRYAICNLNYYVNSRIYTIDFFQDDKINIEKVIKLYNKIRATTYFSSAIKIIDNSWNTHSWISNKSMNFIGVNELYNNQQFQCMKTGTAYGKLIFIDIENEFLSVTKNDILVLNNLPNNLPLCAASITTAYQTPLCHINILAQSRNTPNCVMKNAFVNDALLKYKNKYVSLKITEDTFFIKTVLRQAVFDFNHKRKYKNISQLFCNEKIKKIIPIGALGFKDVNIVGGKAANMGELQKIKTVSKIKIPTPENCFAIPFYFYKEYIRNNRIDSLVEELPTIDDDLLLQEQLKKIRQAIEGGEINADLIAKIKAKIGADSLQNFRFRSSTNAEDIVGFNGAGLYDSKTGTLKNGTKKTVEKAIKEVWSSLWKWRAFVERRYYGIDQTNLAMGILVNRGFGTEEANGVAVTKNLYRDNYPSFTINVQKGEVSVVQPNDSIIAEQFVVNYQGTTHDNDSDISVDYICHSSLQPYEPILSEKETKLLCEYLLAIKKHYWNKYANKQKVTFDNFAMDVEFKLEKDTRKIVIKQARFY